MSVILIVDDNLDDQKMLELLIQSHTEHRTLTAGNAGKALSLAPQADLILLDVMMPDKDGIQVFQELRVNPTTKDIPIIFMTAHPDSIKKKLSQQALGSIDYLLKPIDKDQLINRLNLLVGIKETRTRFQKRKFSEPEQLTLLLATIEQTGDGITVTDRKGKWLMINHSQAAMFGYTTDEFTKLSIKDIYEPASAARIRNEVIPTLEKLSHWEGELNGRKKNGEYFPILLSLSSVEDSSGKFLGIMGITKDISALKKAYADLEKAQEALVRSERLKALGEMVGGIAHEFNNLLANILGNTQLLLESVKEPGQQKRLRTIERASLAGAEAVKRMQIFTLAGAPAAKASLDLRKLLEEVLKTTQPRWRDISQRKGIKIEVDSDLHPVPSIKGEEKELKIALINVVFNAIEALPQGGKIQIRNWANKEFIYIQISDTGTGMSPEVKEKVFEPYFTTKRPLKSGLGLSVTYGTIKKHGGEVEIQTQENQGTTVTIKLPLVEPSTPLEVERHP